MFFIFFLFLNFISCQNFKDDVVKFCQYKSPTNFCSPDHIEIMFSIYDQNEKYYEARREIMRMYNEIARKVFGELATRLKHAIDMKNSINRLNNSLIFTI